MATCNAPVETRFSSTNQPLKHGPAKGTKYFKPMLKELLEEETDWDDPVTKQRIRTTFGKVISLRHIRNAVEGQHNSIVDIMDRADGENQGGVSFGDVNIAVVVRQEDLGERLKQVMNKRGSH